jgi:hypothetical protein
VIANLFHHTKLIRRKSSTEIATKIRLAGSLEVAKKIRAKKTHHTSKEDTSTIPQPRFHGKTDSSHLILSLMDIDRPLDEMVKPRGSRKGKGKGKGKGGSDANASPAKKKPAFGVKKTGAKKTLAGALAEKKAGGRKLGTITGKLAGRGLTGAAKLRHMRELARARDAKNGEDIMKLTTRRRRMVRKLI